MLTNHSGWTAPFKQPFQAKSALYSILKQKVLKIWDISWEYSATLIARLDGLADKIKIKSFSKTKNLGKKKSANCGTQIWSLFVQLKYLVIRHGGFTVLIPLKLTQNWLKTDSNPTHVLLRISLCLRRIRGVRRGETHGFWAHMVSSEIGGGEPRQLGDFPILLGSQGHL